MNVEVTIDKNSRKIFYIDAGDLSEAQLVEVINKVKEEFAK